MDFIKGVTFGAFAPRESLKSKEAKKSLDNLKKRTCADTIVLVPNGLQENAHTENIRFDTKATFSDEELISFIDYAHEIGLKVLLKPTVNCMDGTWRAFISFFDKDVPCEPKWCNWFDSYTKFETHFAKIAKKTDCEMFIAGCEMVQTENKEAQWRKLISDIRAEYDGVISYNTDKYQEDHVNWWDAVDVISSSGYYPIRDWKKELARIEKVVKKFNKPFFFAEAGCMSTRGSSAVPNNWGLKDVLDLEEQADWYRSMFAEIEKNKWVEGTCLWDWACRQYPAGTASTDAGYEIFCKPAEQVVKDFYGMK